MTELQQHPLSAAFPAMLEAERLELKGSIATNGVLTPIVLFEGQVLDGWHRYSIAQELGKDCPMRELEADVDPCTWVLAANSHRRNLTAGQKSAAVAKVFEWRDRGERSFKSLPGRDLNPAPTEHKTAAELADIAGVSVATIERAKKVLTDGAPEVIEALTSGQVSAKRAAEVAKLPKEQQAEALQQPKEYDWQKDMPTRDEVLHELKTRSSLLEQQIESLNKSDATEEIVRLTKVLQAAEVRRDELMNQVADMDRHLRSYGKLFAKLREATGAETNTQAVNLACQAVKEVAHA